MADITLPVTITKHGGTIQTPFGPKEIGDQSETVSVTFHIDETAAETISALLKGGK